MYSMNRVIVHIPKVAGTTLRKILEDQIGSDLIFRDYNIASNAFPGQKIYPETQVIIGHFPFDKYSYFLAHGWKLDTIVREPLDRLESHYNYLQATKDTPRPYLKEWPEDFYSFCMSDHFANHQTRYIPIEVLTELCDFVGVLGIGDVHEQYLEHVGLPIPAIPVTNNFEHKVTVNELTITQLNDVITKNQPDFELYEKAKEIVHQRLYSHDNDN